MKKKHIRKRYLLILVSVLLIIALAAAGYIWFCVPRIHFLENPAILEVKESYDATQFIESVQNGKQEDVQIDGKLHTDKLGTYSLDYKIEGRTYTLKYEVKDTLKPVVTTKELSISINDHPKAEEFVSNVKDATKTTVRFAKDYTFNTIQDETVELIIEDEGKNQTKATAIAHVLEKDTTAPVLSGVHDLTVVKGSTVELSKGVSAIDDRDGKVDVAIDKGNFNAAVIGSYMITYTAKDRAGNTTVKKANIKVQEKGNTKIIYLTIDDGPSANTPKILEILDRYHVKATFFVTAQCPNYLGYIKTAYQKGHAIGLHTYSHNYGQLYASETAYFNDLQKISDIVKQQTGVTSKIIRFPGGSSNTVSSRVPGLMTRLTKAVQEKGYQYYDWNSESGDGNSANSAASLIRTAQSFGGGSPLMMLTHDHSGSNSSVQALPSIIEYYQSLGYTFQTVDTSVDGFHHGVNN